LLALGILALTPWLAGGKPPEPKPPAQGIGNAWTDPENPVTRRFRGKRLDLWSLQKPARPPLPAVRRTDWPRNPIDRFLLARQEALGLAPSPEADRRTLIRRLSFDLWGLPPTPDAVEHFVKDLAPGAYERLVDRLLASKHYGARWGRHWLDVVRYADTNGFERDEFRPNAWRYRDYVLRAFNEDKPYDEFVREQLAGDELAPADLGERGIQQVIATGFLRLGPYDSTAPLFGEDPKGRDQLLADLVNTTGSAFLGLTLACCQCHDHKYDPLLQADHFRLRAFFAAVKFRDDLPIDPPAVRMQIRAGNAGLDARSAALNRQIEPLLRAATGRVRARRQAGFPEEVRQALARPEKELDDATRNQLKPYRNKLKISPRDARAAFTAEEKARYEPLARELAALKGRKRPFGTAMAMVDAGPTAPPTRVFDQGNYHRPLHEVPPGFPSVFDPNPAALPAPPSPRTTGRRLGLAHWIASPDNPLTARVLVNRLWQHHFGQGLVATPNDFGRSGQRPTHPDLLDWLAVEFMDGGWSVKKIHRLIVLSAAYRQASAVDAARKKLDPENRTLWRQNLRRLAAEELHDALLAVSGRLRPTDSGPPAWPHLPLEVMLGQPKIFEDEGGRLEGWYAEPPDRTDVRGVFTVQKRSLPLPLLQAFDLPDSTTSCGGRTVTTVAPQALELFNSPFAVRLARAFAARVAREAGPQPARQVDRAFRLALARGPDPEEKALALRALERHRELHRKTPGGGGGDTSGSPAPDLAPAQAALADLCRALLNVNEFLYVD
jgi:hypothetical protein